MPTPQYTETTQPYEFLIRWTKTGAISGAHVGFRTITQKDGVEIADQVGDVMPVAYGAKAGFPLATILSQIQVDALTERDAAIATLAERDAELTAKTADLSTKEAEVVGLQEALTAAQEALAAKEASEAAVEAGAEVVTIKEVAA